MGSTLQSMGKRAPRLKLERASDRMQIRGGETVTADECMHLDTQVSSEMKSDDFAKRFVVPDTSTIEADRPSVGIPLNPIDAKKEVLARCFALSVLPRLRNCNAGRIYSQDSIPSVLRHVCTS